MEAEGGGRGKGTIATWIDVHRPAYDRATRHPFVLSIRDGTVDFSALKRWLGQNYIFVREFAPFLASVLLKAWKQSDDGSDMDVLLHGMASLHDELSWFKKEASKWDVHLYSTTPQKENLDYFRFFQSLMLPEVEYAVAITAFWAFESLYQESFSHCLGSGSKTPAELMEACQRWGSTGFWHFCRSLQRIADRCLQNAPADVQKKAEEVFIHVLEHEVNFWNLSSGES